MGKSCLASCAINGTYRAKWNADASNQNPDSELYQTPFTGVYRYDVQSEFEQATGNDYTSFSSTYWDTTSGVPV